MKNTRRKLDPVEMFDILEMHNRGFKNRDIVRISGRSSSTIDMLLHVNKHLYELEYLQALEHSKDMAIACAIKQGKEEELKAVMNRVQDIPASQESESKSDSNIETQEIDQEYLKSISPYLSSVGQRLIDLAKILDKALS